MNNETQHVLNTEIQNALEHIAQRVRKYLQVVTCELKPSVRVTYIACQSRLQDRYYMERDIKDIKTTINTFDKFCDAIDLKINAAVASGYDHGVAHGIWSHHMRSLCNEVGFSHNLAAYMFDEFLIETHIENIYRREYTLVA